MNGLETGPVPRIGTRYFAFAVFQRQADNEPSAPAFFERSSGLAFTTLSRNPLAMNHPPMHPSSPLRTIRSRLAISAAIAGFALALGLVAAHLLGFDLERQFWLAKTRLFGKEPVGIWREDSRYGWSHEPNSTGRHREVPDFDVPYHIDSNGRRRTLGAANHPARKILFLGGSFTFGHGVEDGEPYPALLQQQWPELECINAGVNAWGTTQALLTLQDEFEKGERFDLVVYGFISHHVSRNHLRRSWLDVLQAGRDRRNPWFALEGEELRMLSLHFYERFCVSPNSQRSLQIVFRAG